MSGLSAEIARNRPRGGLDTPPLAVEPEAPPATAEAAQEPDIADAPLEQRRRQRKPFGAHVQKLAYPERKGFHRHWFNDVPGRIDRAKEAGYEHVLGDDKKSVKRPVGSKDGGGVLMAYLMEIPQKWYEEDMQAQQKVIDRHEQALAAGKPLDTQGEQQGNFYNSAQGRVTRFDRR